MCTIHVHAFDITCLHMDQLVLKPSLDGDRSNMSLDKHFEAKMEDLPSVHLWVLAMTFVVVSGSESPAPGEHEKDCGLQMLQSDGLRPHLLVQQAHADKTLKNDFTSSSPR